ncbi:WAT1-related protein At3g28130 [Setaria viridis]|uniref:WAT1-related protein At3g28130 n=1 Tax=Setaria viridis TaxID=4556 RepID=UPI003B3A0FF2
MALYYFGLRDTAASYAVIFASMTPLVTFVLSILLGMEKLRLRSKEGSSKVTGVMAALGTAAKYWLNLYAVEKRGPVYPPMFSTLSAVFIIILGTLLLGESLTAGSLLGSFLVLSGLYIYIYGKAKEPQAKTMSGSRDKELQV